MSDEDKGVSCIFYCHNTTPRQQKITEIWLRNVHGRALYRSDNHMRCPMNNYLSPWAGQSAAVPGVSHRLLLHPMKPNAFI